MPNLGAWLLSALLLRRWEPIGSVPARTFRFPPATAPIFFVRLLPLQAPIGAAGVTHLVKPRSDILRTGAPAGAWPSSASTARFFQVADQDQSVTTFTSTVAVDQSGSACARRFDDGRAVFDLSAWPRLPLMYRCRYQFVAAAQFPATRSRHLEIPGMVTPCLDS